MLLNHLCLIGKLLLLLLLLPHQLLMLLFLKMKLQLRLNRLKKRLLLLQNWAMRAQKRQSQSMQILKKTIHLIPKKIQMMWMTLLSSMVCQSIEKSSWCRFSFPCHLTIKCCMPS